MTDHTDTGGGKRTYPIPKFSGKTGEDFDLWLQKITTYCAYTDVLPAMWCETGADWKDNAGTDDDLFSANEKQAECSKEDKRQDKFTTPPRDRAHLSSRQPSIARTPVTLPKTSKNSWRSMEAEATIIISNACVGAAEITIRDEFGNSAKMITKLVAR